MKKLLNTINKSDELFHKTKKKNNISSKNTNTHKLKLIITITMIFFLILIAKNMITSQNFQPNETAITLSIQAEKELERYNYIQAISLFNKAIKLNEYYVPARVGLARAYYYLKNYETAYTEIEEARQIDRNSIIVLIWSAKINIKLENYTKAKKDLDLASNIDARDFELLMTYGEYYREIGQYTESIRYFDLAAGTEETFVEPLIAKGDVYMILNRSIEALESYELALIRNPRAVSANYSLANFYYLTNNLKMALEYIENAVVIEPSVKNLELNYKLLFELAKWGEAELILKKLILNFIDIEPDYYNDLGVALSKQGKYQESVIFLISGIEEFRGDEILRWRAEMVAIEGLKINNEYRKKLAKYRYEMGVFYQEKNIIDKAIFMLDRAIQIDPQNLNYRYKIASIYKDRGYSDKYLHILKFIIKEDPDFPNIQDDLEYYKKKLETSLSGKLNIDQYNQVEPYKDLKPMIVISNIETEKESDSYYEANNILQDILYRALKNSESFSISKLDKSKTRNESDELNRMGADLVIRPVMTEMENLLSVKIEVLNVNNGVSILLYKDLSHRGNDRFLKLALSFAENISKDLPVMGLIRDKKENEVILNIGSLQNINVDDILYIIGDKTDYRVFLRKKENFNIEKIQSLSKAEIMVDIVDERILKGHIISGSATYIINTNNYVLLPPSRYNQ